MAGIACEGTSVSLLSQADDSTERSSVMAGIPYLRRGASMKLVSATSLALAAVLMSASGAGAA
jgi:hypothetical protein